MMKDEVADRAYM